MKKMLRVGTRISADAPMSALGFGSMLTQAPSHLRPDQCMQQMLVRLVGTHEPQLADAKLHESGARKRSAAVKK